MLTYPMYAVLFDFCALWLQTKILVFQGTLVSIATGIIRLNLLRVWNHHPWNTWIVTWLREESEQVVQI